MSKAKLFIVRLIANILILGGFVILGYTYLPIVAGEAWYQIMKFRHMTYSLTAPKPVQGSVFEQYLKSGPISLQPVNSDFSILIEKIGVTAPIVKNVSVSDEDAYMSALDGGVAHAVGTALPGERGNIYLFAHSSIGFFRFSKYAAVFNLLRKLDKGDKIHLYYQNKDYVYEVLGKEVVDGWNTYPLIRTVLEPTLTLQTCDPPGTTFNRLVVTSRLVKVQ
jgi:sortase A